MSEISDRRIRNAIKSRDDPDHPDSADVDEIRSILDDIQESVTQYWAEYKESAESSRGNLYKAHEDDDIVIFGGAGFALPEEMNQVGVTDKIVRGIVITCHDRESSSRLSDPHHNTTSLVVERPAETPE